MQGLLEPPREALTEAAVTAGLLAPGVVFGFGCDMTDMTLANVEPITAHLLGGSVSRASYDTLHGSANLTVAADLPFGYAVLKPWCTMYDGITLARYDLGAYFTNTPVRPLAEKPVTYQVRCRDILSVLSNLLGDAYTVDAGEVVLAKVEEILLSQGIHHYIINQASGSATLSEDKSWPFDDKTTWLTVINDLLQYIGYAGIWTDWHGRFRCEPYQSPRTRPAEWSFEVNAENYVIAPEREEEYDYELAPNSYVFVRNNGFDQAPPVDGDGIYRFDNERDGPLSQEARRRTILRRVPLDVADHTSLVAAAQRIIDEGMQIPRHYRPATAPFPLFWHFDVLALNDPDRGPATTAMATQWTLPLDGKNMTHDWTILS